MPVRRVVVAGAGIAGLTSALALAARGFEVTVCERARVLSEVGAGLQLSPNCGRILSGLGLDAALDAHAVRPEAIDIRSGPSGRRIVALPLGASAAARHGGPYRVLHRADLQKALLGAVLAQGRVTLALEAAVDAVEEGRDGLGVTVAGEPIEADLVVGADGVRSTVRGAVAGAAMPRPTGRTAWRATVPADAAGPLLAAMRTTLFLGPAAHLVAYPISGGAAVNLVAVVEDPHAAPGWDEPADLAVLDAAFADWAEPVRALIDGPLWRRFTLNAVDPAGRWATARIALLGDAAHAMLPFLAQGAAMAIEDAAVLAAELADAPATPAAALRRYEARRKPRVTKVWQGARTAGRLYHLGRIAALARDAGMAALGGPALLARYDWLYGWTPEEG